MTTADLLTLHLRLGFYNIKDAARYVDVKEETFRRNIERGQIPRPSHRLPGGRQYFYTEEEVKHMREEFAQRRRYKRHYE